MDQLSAMRMFVTVSDLQSFRRAAEELDVSPSVISKHISALEQHLGAQLLTRTTRRLKLSTVGERYLQTCRLILNEVDGFEAALNDQTGQLKGMLRVNAPAGFTHRHISPHLPLFLEQHPEMIVDIATATNETAGILSSVDLHIKISEMFVPSGCEMEVLAQNRRVLVASPGYVDAHGQPATTSELAQHRLVTLDPTHPNNDWHFRTDDGGTETFRAHGQLRLDNGDGLLRTVLNDGGVCMLPTYIVGRHLSSGALVPILDAQVDESTPVHGIWRSKNHRWPKIKAFIQFLRDIYGELPYWDDPNATESPAFIRASK